MKLEYQVIHLKLINIFLNFLIFYNFFSEFSPQIAELIPKANSESVRIVFLLTLNGRALRQVHRLLKTLYNSRHFYFIHVDSVCLI